MKVGKIIEWSVGFSTRMQSTRWGKKIGKMIGHEEYQHGKEATRREVAEVSIL